MKRFYTLLLPALLFSLVSFAQSNFRPGYVVTAAGDTLKGDIDHQEWVRNPNGFNFKDKSEKVVTYTAKDAKAFGIDGLDHYTLATLSVSMDQVETSRLSTRFDATVTTVTAFLKALTRGQYLSLYSYTDDLKTRYIIIDNKTGEISELSHHFYLDQTKRAVVEISRYRIELNAYADTYQKNTSSLKALIQWANYTANDLSRAVNTINGDDVKKRTSVNGKRSFRFFAGAALNSSKLSYRYDTDLAVDPKDHSDLFPQVGLGFDYFVDPNVGRLIIRGELSFYSATMKAVAANASKEISSFTVNLHPQFIYNFYNTAPLKIFAGAGLLAHFSNYTKNSYVTTRSYTYGNEDEEPATVWLALPIKAGIVLNRSVELYGTYCLPANIDRAPFLQASGRISSLQLGFNYLFGSKK